MVSVSPLLANRTNVVTPPIQTTEEIMFIINEVPNISPSLSGDSISSYTNIASKPSLIMGMAKDTIEDA